MWIKKNEGEEYIIENHKEVKSKKDIPTVKGLKTKT